MKEKDAAITSSKLKKMGCIALVLLLLVTMQNPITAHGAANGIVYEYSKMIENNGNIYYIQSIEGTKDTYTIYWLNPADGNSKKIAASTSYITALVVYNKILYYTSYTPGGTDYTTYSVSIDGGTPKAICKGLVCYADKSGIYYTVNTKANCLLYRKSFQDTADKLLYTGNSTFQYVKNIGNTLYFGEFTASSSQIHLSSLVSGKSKLSVLSTWKASADTSSTPTISDVALLKGNIYYQFGTYEGSGGFWYGTLVKVSGDSKRSSVITDKMISSVISHSDSNIYFDDMESFTKHYSYSVTSGKTSSYSCKVEDSSSFNVLGGYTYSAKPAGMKYITLSRFTSGTNYKNKTADFIKFTYPQSPNQTYIPSVKSLGNYLLIPITCIDFNDASYGWRGHTLKVTWYVADLDGKVLTHFE